MSKTDQAVIIGLDIGAVRVGIARAGWPVGIAQPWKTIQNDMLLDELQRLVADEHVHAIIVGMPRNLSGQDTLQTSKTRTTVQHLKTVLTVPVYWQDEALTSVKAEEELKTRKKPYNKTDIDALSAAYILEDYIKQNRTS